MNRSGFAVRDIIDLYKIENRDITVVLDDFNLDLNVLRFRLQGSSGGHNGLQSIIDIIGTESIKRLRIGIGHPDNEDPADYVLSEFSSAEEAKILTISGADALETVIIENEETAMNLINQRRLNE